NDKFVVREPDSESEIWWGQVNVPLDTAHFERLREDVLDHLAGRELFVQDMHAGADPDYRIGVRAITPNAWHALFINNMFIEPTAAERESFEPGFTILHAPEYQADPSRHGTRSSTFVVISFAERTVLIGGTRYAGELK